MQVAVFRAEVGQVHSKSGYYRQVVSRQVVSRYCRQVEHRREQKWNFEGG